MIYKKGAIEISLSWVFMIIVGSFFLILAYNVIDKYQEIEEDKYNLEVKQTLRSILNNVGRTSGIEDNSLEITDNIFKNKEVEIFCENGFPLLSIDGDIDGNNEFLRNYPIFMSYIEEGSIPRTYLAVESYKLPFKITNVVGIVSKKNLIVFDKESEISDKFLYKFRRGSYEDLNYVVLEDLKNLDFDFFKSEYKDQGLNSVVFVGDLGEVPIDIKFLEDLKYYSFFVEFEEIDLRYGVISFTDEVGSRSYNYYDLDESMTLQTMAIFSKPEVFDCSYNLLIEKTKPVYSFYINRTNYFLNKIDSGEEICSTVNNVFAKDYYLDFRDILENSSDKLINDGFSNILEIDEKIRSIESKQRSDIEIFSCPLIY